MIAVFADEAAQKAIQNQNIHVLPILKADHDALGLSSFTVFEATEDHAWKHVNAELTKEMETHNAKTRAAARAAGQPVSVEKAIAYKYDTALGHLMEQYGFCSLLGSVRVLVQERSTEGFRAAAAGHRVLRPAERGELLVELGDEGPAGEGGLLDHLVDGGADFALDGLVLRLEVEERDFHALISSVTSGLGGSN